MPPGKPLPVQILALDKLFLRAVKLAPWKDFTMRQSFMLIRAYDGPATILGLHIDMQVDKPALTRGADLHERLGLMKRQEDPLDRRSVLLVITDQGRRAVEKLAGL